MKKLPATKINVSGYIGRMNSTVKETKCKGRPIYRLHEHFNWTIILFMEFSIMIFAILEYALKLRIW